MPNIRVLAAGGALPAAKLQRFRPVLGDAAIQMAAAALQIERDAAFIATAMSLIDGGAEYRVWIDHPAGLVMISRRPS